MLVPRVRLDRDLLSAKLPDLDEVRALTRAVDDKG